MIWDKDKLLSKIDYDYKYQAKVTEDFIITDKEGIKDFNKLEKITIQVTRSIKGPVMNIISKNHIVKGLNFYDAVNIINSLDIISKQTRQSMEKDKYWICHDIEFQEIK